MSTVEQLADFLGSNEIPGIRRARPYLPQVHGYSTPQTSPEKVAEDLLSSVEFRALRLGTWLGTPDGQLLAQAVEMVSPPIYRYDVEILVDGLKLAAQIQQREGRRVAGLVALLVVLVVGLLAFGGQASD